MVFYWKSGKIGSVIVDCQWRSYAAVCGVRPLLMHLLLTAHDHQSRSLLSRNLQCRAPWYVSWECIIVFYLWGFFLREMYIFIDWKFLLRNCAISQALRGKEKLYPNFGSMLILKKLKMMAVMFFAVCVINVQNCSCVVILFSWWQCNEYGWISILFIIINVLNIGPNLAVRTELNQVLYLLRSSSAHYWCVYVNCSATMFIVFG